MSKIINAILLGIASISSLSGALVREQGATGFGPSWHQTWYLGSNDQCLKYAKFGPGATVDDGIFVAILDGGKYGGYSYYELRHPRSGYRDGGPAYLPPNPGSFPDSGHYAIARSGAADFHGGPPIHPTPGSIETRGEDLPELPDQSLIPIGSRFFYWVSRGGSFNLGSAFVHEIPSKKITVRVQAQPREEFANWLEPSDVVEEVYTLLLED